MAVPLEPGMTVHVGDQVRLTLADGSLLRATILAYGLPLAGLLLAAGAALISGRPDAESVVWGLLGTTAGYVLARRRLRQAHCLSSLQPRLDSSVQSSAPTRCRR